MKTLILAINSKYVHTLLAPHYLKENCTCGEIDIFESNINANIDEIVSSIFKYSPDILAASVYIFNVNFVETVLRKIKTKLPNLKIVLGGPEVSFEYENCYEYADNIIVGEGEVAFNKVINAYFKKEKIEKIVFGEPMSLSEVKTPYTPLYFKMCKGKIAYFEASRGCPFKCAYCMSGNTVLRCFDLKQIEENLLKFKNADIRVLKFVDRTFNANNKFACEILRFILKHHDFYSFSFHFEIAGDLITDEFLEIIGASPLNLFQFEIGVQSFNEKTLKEINRKTNLKKVIDNIKKLIDLSKCHVHTDLIAGLPFEDLDSFKNSFNILYKLKSDMLQLGFLKVLKGSSLKATLTTDYVYAKNAPYEIISTPYLKNEEVLELKMVEDAVDKYYNSGNFKNTLEMVVSENAYDFYLVLSKFESDNLFSRIDSLLKCLVTLGFNIDLIKNLLKMDYVLSNNSRVIPEVLKTYNPDFNKILMRLNLNRKKLFCTQLDINPKTLVLEKGIIAINYKIFPFAYTFYPIA